MLYRRILFMSRNFKNRNSVCYYIVISVIESNCLIKLNKNVENAEIVHNTGNFSFFHDFLKSRLLQRHKSMSVCEKGFTQVWLYFQILICPDVCELAVMIRRISEKTLTSETGGCTENWLDRSWLTSEITQVYNIDKFLYH